MGCTTKSPSALQVSENESTDYTLKSVRGKRSGKQILKSVLDTSRPCIVLRLTLLKHIYNLKHTLVHILIPLT